MIQQIFKRSNKNKNYYLNRFKMIRFNKIYKNFNKINNLISFQIKKFKKISCLFMKIMKIKFKEIIKNINQISKVTYYIKHKIKFHLIKVKKKI